MATISHTTGRQRGEQQVSVRKEEQEQYHERKRRGGHQVQEPRNPCRARQVKSRLGHDGQRQRDRPAEPEQETADANVRSSGTDHPADDGVGTRADAEQGQAGGGRRLLGAA